MSEKVKLTAKQEAFCINFAVHKMSQRQAYIEAYGRGNLSAKSIDEIASRLSKNVKVVSRIKELQEALTDKVLWAKADMIQDLKDIAIECKTAPKVILIKGDLHSESIDSKARSVAVNAIKTAGEMLGYKSAETEVNVTIKLEDIMNKIGGKNDY